MPVRQMLLLANPSGFVAGLPCFACEAQGKFARQTDGPNNIPCKAMLHIIDPAHGMLVWHCGGLTKAHRQLSSTRLRLKAVPCSCLTLASDAAFPECKTGKHSKAFNLASLKHKIRCSWSCFVSLRPTSS